MTSLKFWRYLLAVLFPPASVYMLHGLSVTLLISVLLTFCGWVPGIIHAIWVSAKHDEAASPGNY
ncbi:MAG: hypothetical protein RLZZ511_2797 [Cyanobacteriota bacterium]|jgi:uncharacterized membrane protein YqaE (UPF0057 family)